MHILKKGNRLIILYLNISHFIIWDVTFRISFAILFIAALPLKLSKMKDKKAIRHLWVKEYKEEKAKSFPHRTTFSRNPLLLVLYLPLVYMFFNIWGHLLYRFPSYIVWGAVIFTTILMWDKVDEKKFLHIWKKTREIYYDLAIHNIDDDNKWMVCRMDIYKELEYKMNISIRKKRDTLALLTNIANYTSCEFFMQSFFVVDSFLSFFIKCVLPNKFKRGFTKFQK